MTTACGSKIYPKLRLQRGSNHCQWIKARRKIHYELTAHARKSLRKGPLIFVEWLERVLQQCELVELDRVDPELEHRLGRIQEADGRVLRVIVKRDTNPLRIVSVYFDRKMRRKL